MCVEPENPELLDVSCLDEVVDCEFQTSHEHVDLDQGEAKDRLRTVDDVSGSARDQLQFFSHVDTPAVRELDRDERLIFSEDNSVISHKQQDNSTTPAVERLVFENDSSVISHKQSSGLYLKMTAALSHTSNRTTAPHQQLSVLCMSMVGKQLSVVLAWRISLMRLRLAAWIAQRGEVFLE